MASVDLLKIRPTIPARTYLNFCSQSEFIILFTEKQSDLPNSDSTPHAIQMMKLNPTEPVRINKPDGDTKIPDPEKKYIKF